MSGKTVRRLLVAVPALLLCSCSSYVSTFSPPVLQETEVKLKQNGFQHVATDLVGHADCWYILGSIPLGDNRLFSRALAELYTGAQGKMTGRPAQLVNWTLDVTDLTFFVAHKESVVFRADLMEYTK